MGNDRTFLLQQLENASNDVERFNIVSDFLDEQEKKFLAIKELLADSTLQEHGAVRKAWELADDSAWELS